MVRELVLAAALLTGSGVAQAAERFTLQPSGDGYVRMDTQTGAVSTCTRNGDQIVCQLGADERTAWQDELDRLQTRVEALEKRMETLEATALKTPTLPSDADIERSLGFMERFFRRFMDIVRDFQEEPPQRT